LPQRGVTPVQSNHEIRLAECQAIFRNKCVTNIGFLFRNKCVTNCLTVRLLRSKIRGEPPRVRIAHKWKNASSERGREEARALFFFLLQPRCLDSRHPRVHERFELLPDPRRSPEIRPGCDMAILMQSQMQSATQSFSAVRRMM